MLPPKPVVEGRQDLARRVVGRPVDHPAAETRRAYAGDWSRFVGWCRHEGLCPLPASPDTALRFLRDASAGLGRGTLRRRRAAIAAAHRENGWPPPMLDPVGQVELRSRVAYAPASNTVPDRPTSAALRQLAAVLPDDLVGRRDRAMLLVLAAAADSSLPVTRAALLGLDAEHVRLTPGGAELRLRARPDAAEPTLVLPLARSATATLCPVRALEGWMHSSDTAYGPLWRKVDRWGGIEHTRLGPDSWRRILARRTAKGGMTARG